MRLLLARISHTFRVSRQRNVADTGRAPIPAAGGIDIPSDAGIKRNAVAVAFRKDSPKGYEKCGLVLALGLLGFVPLPLGAMERVAVAKDGAGFILADSGERFRPWGVNYDHDADGRLIEDYWHDEWATVEEDFGEIKALGANVVRVHLQLGKFMASAEKPAERELARLADLLELAERNGLYLDLTGLACYHKADVPKWYDALGEEARWEVQARFWSAIAKRCTDSPAVFCYDLMNEPVLPGNDEDSDWLLGEFGGKFFVQRIALELKGRSREAITQSWIGTMVDAIRAEDRRSLITVGVIPWATVWPNAKPLFHDPEIGRRLDFVSVHFYPEADKIDKALSALEVYDLGKPVVVEEFFPLKCSGEQMEKFVDGAREIADGWISFYWGKPAAEYPKDEISGALVADWLRRFEKRAPQMTRID